MILSAIVRLQEQAEESGITSEVVDSITMPKVEWKSLGAINVLIAGALVLLVIASLARHTRWISGVYVWFTVATAAIAGAFGFWRWDAARNLTKDPGAVANAIKIDGFSVFITVLVCAIVIISALIVEDYLRRENLHGPEVFVLMMLSASGAIIMASANDLIVLFLGLEILSIPLYVLAGSHLRRAESQEAALKYFVLGGFSSAVFLYGSALIYGATGSTNLTEITTYLGSNQIFGEGVITGNGLLIAGIVLFLVGLGFKVSAVPFHMWTPDVYQGSPSPVAGFMAAGAKVAGFAALLRVLLTAMATQTLDWRPVVWVLAIASMIVGAILSAVQTDVKRLMAYSSVSHAGFILIGLQAASTDGASGALFYLFTYSLIVLGSFAVISIVGRYGDAAHSLTDYKGLGRRSPALAIVFTLFLLGQAGIPATSGFMAKFGVIRAAVDVKSYAIAIIAMFVSVVGAFAYLRVIVSMFMSDDEHDAAHGHAEPAVASVASVVGGVGALTIPWATRIAILVAAAATLFFGIAPQTLVNFASDALLR
jgi:NADH-quinone oxidoreductase subunit N